MPLEEESPELHPDTEPVIVGIQIMCPTTAFPGVPVGTIIENPSPEQIAAANEVRSCVHFMKQD